MDRPELADFLTSRRKALLPADVGLPAGPRRRTQGLRREEVAMLASMSTDYYTRLEQQRGPQPSPQIISSLARALRLTPDERDYLHRVAGHPAPERGWSGDYVPPSLLRVLDRLFDTPALVINLLGEVLVQNDLARALYGDRTSYEGLERSEIYRWFMAPDVERAVYPVDDQERQSRAQVASLRAAYGALGARSRAGDIVHELLKRSPEFAALWKLHEVQRRFQDHKILLHPEVGAIEVDCQALFTEDQTLALLVLTAPPRTEAAEKIRLLGVLGTQRFAAPG